jgi:hypothetical protein
MPDTENLGRASCPPVADKRRIRKKRQIAREGTLWETNDRDVLLAEAVGGRKLNAASQDNQEVEFGLAFTEKARQRRSVRLRKISVSRQSHLALFRKADCWCRRAEIPGVG